MKNQLEYIRTKNQQLMQELKQQLINKVQIDEELRFDIYRFNHDISEYVSLVRDLTQMEFYDTIDVRHLSNKFSAEEKRQLLISCEYFKDVIEVTNYFEASVQQIESALGDYKKNSGVESKSGLLKSFLVNVIEVGQEQQKIFEKFNNYNLCIYEIFSQMVGDISQAVEEFNPSIQAMNGELIKNHKTE